MGFNSGHSISLFLYILTFTNHTVKGTFPYDCITFMYLIFSYIQFMYSIDQILHCSNARF